MKKMIVALLLCLALVFTMTACSEAVKTYVISSSIRLSEFPQGFKVLDVLMIDLDFSNVGEDDAITAEISCPAVVNDALESILIYDGWHAIQGRWKRTDAGTLLVTFYLEDLQWLDGISGLHLVMVGIK